MDPKFINFIEEGGLTAEEFMNLDALTRLEWRKIYLESAGN